MGPCFPATVNRRVKSMKCRLLTVFVLGFYFGMVQFASPMEPPLKVEEGKESLHIAGKYLDLKVSLSQPQFLRVTVDSLGSGRFPAGDLRSPPKVPRPTVVKRTNNKVEYRGRDQAPSAPGRWMFEFDEKTIRLVSRWSENDPPEPVVLDFDLKQCHATILGLVKSEGKMALPAVMHLPDQGSFRITTNSPSRGDIGFRRPACDRSVCQNLFPARDERNAPSRISLGGDGDLSEAGRHRRQSTI